MQDPSTVPASALSVRRRQQVEIDRAGHRQIPRTVGMEKIDDCGAAVRLELGPQSASGRIHRHGVEVGYRIEDTGTADEGVDGLAARVELGAFRSCFPGST